MSDKILTCATCGGNYVYGDSDLHGNANCLRHLKSRAEAAERENERLRKALDFHHRAAKLMLKHKEFIVIAVDEPYFKQAYDLIRKNEMQNGTWTKEDQWHYDEALKGGDE